MSNHCIVIFAYMHIAHGAYTEISLITRNLTWRVNEWKRNCKNKQISYFLVLLIILMITSFSVLRRQKARTKKQYICQMQIINHFIFNIMANTVIDLCSKMTKYSAPTNVAMLHMYRGEERMEFSYFCATINWCSFNLDFIIFWFEWSRFRCVTCSARSESLDIYLYIYLFKSIWWRFYFLI